MTGGTDWNGVRLDAYKASWLALHITGGQVGMPALVLTFLLSKRVRSHPTIINFCVTWIIYSISFCLLIYGGQSGAEHPNTALCLVQAGLIHGAPGMSAVAGLFVVVHAWSKFHDPEKRWLPKAPRWLLHILILSPPYAVFLAFSLLYALYGVQHPDSLNPTRGLYCTMSKLPWQRYAIPGLCLSLMAIIVALEGVILYKLLSRRRYIKHVFPLIKRRPSLSLCFRIALFTLYTWASLGACVFLINSVQSPAPYFVQASLPLAAFTFFGVQKETFFTWCFWWRTEPEVPSGPLVTERKASIAPRRAFPFTPVTPIDGVVPWEHLRDDFEPGDGQQDHRYPRAPATPAAGAAPWEHQDNEGA